MNNRHKPKKPNPWNKNTDSRQPAKTAANTSGSNVSSESKFKDAQKKLQASVQKHIKEYESSSEEEDVSTSIVIEKIIANYTSTGSPNEKLTRTELYLKDTLSPGATTCLICISKVKRDDQVWSCGSCYCFFHLMCIQRWSKDNISQKKQAQEAQIVTKQISICWACPKCREEYGADSIPKEYKCFCQKKINPTYQSLLAPHSCGEICGKDLKPPCGHKCLLLCHPGPCPPCPVTVNARCYCGAKPPRLQRCSDKYWSCGGSCGKLLECEKHYCDDPCHDGDCKPCPKKSIQKCMCKSKATLRDCSSPIWQCDKVCGKFWIVGNTNA
ncbi:hypothetical protein WA026_020593 [Henosepilachna vigintioctopunctata]|uniref:RING-type domain-containing protein n=1 Tax=Henosepilachna vigintioctopunctata TaxID=420089 RepID=A0AAW1V4U9_9CUCU